MRGIGLARVDQPAIGLVERLDAIGQLKLRPALHQLLGAQLLVRDIGGAHGIGVVVDELWPAIPDQLQIDPAGLHAPAARPTQSSTSAQAA